MKNIEKKDTKKPNIQKTILKILAEKPAVSVDELIKKVDNKTPLLFKEGVGGGNSKSPPRPSGTPPQKGGERKNYALTRSIKNLVEAGCIEIHKSDNQNYLKITPKGKNKLNCIKLEGEETLVPNTWDGFWRIIILDIPEERKNEREALRYLLKKANFICIKNTVWISPHPYENLFTNIKKDLGLKTELMILVADKIDDETKKYFMRHTQY